MTRLINWKRNVISEWVGNLLDTIGTSGKQPSVLNIGLYGATSSGKTHVLYSLIEWGLCQDYLPRVAGIKLEGSNTIHSGYKHAVIWNQGKFTKYISKGLYVPPTDALDKDLLVYECLLVMPNGRRVIVRFADIPGEAFKLNTDELHNSAAALDLIQRMGDQHHPLRVTDEQKEACANGASDPVRKLVKDYFIPFYFVINHADVLLVCDPQTDQQPYLASLADMIASHRTNKPKPALISVATKCDDNAAATQALGEAITANRDRGTYLIMDKVAPELTPGKMLTSFCGSTDHANPFVSFQSASQNLLDASIDSPVRQQGIAQSKQRIPIGFHDIWLNILWSTGHWNETELGRHLEGQGLKEPADRTAYLERLRSTTR